MGEAQARCVVELGTAGLTASLLFLPGMTEMVRKITLSRAVRIMQSLFPEEYNFYPRSWILPDELQLFITQVDALTPSPGPQIAPLLLLDLGVMGDATCWGLSPGPVDWK